MDDYAISKERAQRYFLDFDQEELLRRWPLQHDEDYIFVTFLHRDYRICRRTGQVLLLPQMQEADFGEVLSIFDLLCHAGQVKTVTGMLAPVNSLKGGAALGVGTDFHREFARKADLCPEDFSHACLACGGVPVDMGDMGFRFEIFADLPVVVKFYHSDMDFPATVTLLWEENMLQFVYYETVFYIAGVLLTRLERAMAYV